MNNMFLFISFFGAGRRRRGRMNAALKILTQNHGELVEKLRM